MTYRNYIISLYCLPHSFKELSCAEITKKVAYKFKKDSKYLNGGISSLLLKMVKDGTLTVSPKKGPRGGKTYRLT